MVVIVSEDFASPKWRSKTAVAESLLVERGPAAEISHSEHLRLLRICHGVTGSLFKRVYLVDPYPSETLIQPARPANLDPLNLVALSKPEVNPHVVVRNVARAAADF